MARGDGFKLFEERMLAKQAKKSTDGFRAPMDFIKEILQQVIAMILECFVSRPQRLRRRRLNLAPLAARIEKVTGCTWDEAFEMATDCCDLADSAKDGELQSVIDDCKSEYLP